MRNGLAVKIYDLSFFVATGAAVGVKHRRGAVACIERRLFDRGQRVGRTMEVRVVAGIARIVPLVDGGHEFGRRHPQLARKILDGIGGKAIAFARRVERRGDLVGHHARIAIGIQDIPGGFRHGQMRPLAAELHMPVARTDIGLERHIAHRRPVDFMVGIPIHEEAAAGGRHRDAVLLGRAHRHIRAVNRGNAGPESGTAVHMPHIGADACTDVMAVAFVHPSGDRTCRGARKVIGTHLRIVLEASAAHHDAFARFDVIRLVVEIVYAADDLLAGRILHEGGQTRAELVVDDVG